MGMTAQKIEKPRKERKDNADRRRRQILDAAFRSIVQNGLSKTTLATVANEAGLSQGVAVFYYKSKNGLLTAVLQDIYQRYEDKWKAHLEKAGDDPYDKLVAIIEADFDKDICNPSTLSVWLAFWGEQKFTPQYAEITGQFDRKRSEAIAQICNDLLGGADEDRARLISEWADTLTDGYWQKLHLFPDEFDRDRAVETTMQFLARIMPEFAARRSG